MPEKCGECFYPILKGNVLVDGLSGLGGVKKGKSSTAGKGIFF